MKKVHYIRHQHEGIVWQFPFEQRPTAEQAKPILDLLDARHGTHSKKTKEPLWVTVVEVALHGPGDVPSVELPRKGEGTVTVSGAVEASDAGLAAMGEVKNS